MKKKYLVVLIAAVAVIAVLVAVLAGNGEKPAEVQPTATPEITAVPAPAMTAAPTANPNMTIDAAYGIALQFPVKYADVLVHQQEVHGAQITELFSMRVEENSIPLFRIDFGSEEAGDWFGVLNTEVGVVPVVHTAFALSDEELSGMDETTKAQYFELMNSFNDALSSIAADPRFSADKPLAVGEDVEVKTTYWTFTLPSSMTVAETKENDTHVVMFYGMVAGEKTALYTVRIGDDMAESELGLFDVEGVKKPISVGSFDLTEKIDWTEDDYTLAYRMMDTINTVIETIMASEQFSIPTV